MYQKTILSIISLVCLFHCSGPEGVEVSPDSEIATTRQALAVESRFQVFDFLAQSQTLPEEMLFKSTVSGTMRVRLIPLGELNQVDLDNFKSLEIWNMDAGTSKCLTTQPLGTNNVGSGIWAGNVPITFGGPDLRISQFDRISYQIVEIGNGSLSLPRHRIQVELSVSP